MPPIYVKLWRLATGQTTGHSNRQRPMFQLLRLHTRPMPHNRRSGALAGTDPDSDCRCYSRTQVARARRIRLMREMDIPLEKVRGVLETCEEETPAATRLHAPSGSQQLAS